MHECVRVLECFECVSVCGVWTENIQTPPNLTEKGIIEQKDWQREK